MFDIMMPYTSVAWQSVLIEIIVTFVFVTAVLLVKSIDSAKNFSSGWLKCATIALALMACITMAGPHTSASLNPAVSLALGYLNGVIGATLNAHTFWTIYMVGPFVGGALAGLFSLLHGYALKTYSEVQNEEEDEEPADKQD